MTAIDHLEAARAMYEDALCGSPAQPGTDSAGAWHPIDLIPVLAGECTIPPPALLARDDGAHLLYSGRLHIFLGEPESLKSWLAFYAAAQELSRGQHVAYLDYEDAAGSAVERLLAFGAKPDDIEAHFSYFEAPPACLDEQAKGLLLSVTAERGQVSLAIFDGVTEAMAALGLDPNVGRDVAALYAGAPRWFAKAGAAVVLLDHVTKNREGRGRWAIGSERKLSGIDGAAYSLDTLQSFGRERTGKVKVSVVKDRPGYVRHQEGQQHMIATFELHSWPDGRITPHLAAAEMENRDAPFRPTMLMERVSRTLEGAAEPLSQNQICSLTLGKKKDLILALSRLNEDGFATSKPGPRSATLYRSAKPFRADHEVPHVKEPVNSFSSNDDRF